LELLARWNQRESNGIEIRFNRHFILGNEQNETEYSNLSLDYFNSEKNICQDSNMEFNMFFLHLS